MNRKRPAQRQTRSRSVVKSKTRSYSPTRGSRSTAKRSLVDGLRAAASKKTLSRPWFSKRKKPTVRTSSASKKSSTNTGSWLQTFLLWIVLLAVGGWIAWYILLWGVGPKLLGTSTSSTVAILPKTAGGDVLVAQIVPDLRDSTLYILNGEETVTLPGEYGQYRLSAVYPLLLIDAKDERYFRGTLNRVFGVFLDDEVLVKGPLSGTKLELQREVKDAFWDALINETELKLNLLRVWYILHYNNTVVETLSAQALVDEIRLQTGGTFAARDECRVAILNSTTTPGLAGGLADIVERNGGIVIRLGQFSDTLEKSKILYDPAIASCQEAIDQIATLSPVPFEIVEDATVQGTFRAPVVAIIGKNFE